MGTPCVMIDTEFERESTYWPILSLLQIGIEDETYIIDALEPEISLSTLEPFFINPDVIKVMHSARQDLDILYRLFQKIPYPIFDTQIAACYLGYRENIGFGELVLELTGVTLDKSLQHTNWIRRPLDPAQLSYAAQDVIYLKQIFDLLYKRLLETNRLSWLEEDHQKVFTTDLFEPNPDEQWRRIKTPNRKPQSLMILKTLASWRETTAQKLDISRSRLLSDNILRELSALPPITEDKFAHILRKNRNLIGNLNFNVELWAHMNEAFETPMKQWPKGPVYKRSSEEEDKLLEILNIIVNQKSEQLGISARLLAPKDELKNIVRLFFKLSLPGLLVTKNDFSLLKGWRLQEIGQDLLNALEAFPKVNS